jgi:hypothetical protein
MGNNTCNLPYCNRWAATVGPQPLGRLITPIGFGDKALKINPTVFGQAFFQKGCDHAVARVFDQTFSQKVCVCEQAFSQRFAGLESRHYAGEAFTCKASIECTKRRQKTGKRKNKTKRLVEEKQWLYGRERK